MPEGTENGERAPSPRPFGRQRAPTITIDTSAVSGTETEPAVVEDSHNLARPETSDGASSFYSQQPSVSSPLDLKATNSFESKESRPISPHNISSPAHKTMDAKFLSVPGSRSRGNSVDSSASVSGTSATYVNSPTEDQRNAGRTSNAELLSDEEALKPDPGTEADFEVEDNKFAFTPGQLGKLINPKSLGAFRVLGGLTGLVKGLRTDLKTGLSTDEKFLDGYVSFEDATQVRDPGSMDPTSKTPQRTDTMKSAKRIEHVFADRIRAFKDNRLPERKSKSFFRLAWMAFNDKILILLTIAALISLALGIFESTQPHPNGEPRVEWVEGVAIMVAVFVVVSVGALNDWQKERQFVKLNNKKDDRFVKLRRNGKEQEIIVHDVLVGDIVMLEPGDLVPVDGIFIKGYGVKCDESSATGESDLMRKTPAADVQRALENKEDCKKMDPFILSGAKVQEGTGEFLVTSTGIYSSYGKVMLSLREDAEVTPLQSKLNVLAEYIAKLGGAAALLLFTVVFIRYLVNIVGPEKGLSAARKGQLFLDIVIVTITIVVVAVPEGLPLAVTLALAFATTQMLKDNNLVRLLRSCETMGNATTICSDKTGTLTQNKMTIVAGTLGTVLRFGDKKLIAPTDDGNGMKGSNLNDTDDIYPAEFVSSTSEEMRELFKQSIAINSKAFESEEDGEATFTGSKTETAGLSFARDYLGMGPLTTERSNADIVQEIPFDSGRKCSSAIVKNTNGTYRMYVKGASEILLKKATKIVAEPSKSTDVADLTDDNRKTLEALIEAYASRSLRTIGFLYRDFEQWPPKGAEVKDDPTQADFRRVFENMTFLGVVGIQDPLRDGVRSAVEDCQKAGVFVRMVTGDNVTTAKAIAEDCGILVPGGLVLEGPVFRKMSKRQMDQAIPKLCVLARSSPEDKRILVKRLKELGETVAVTGDGTNDAPALKASDIGFAMGISGTEVAKEASAIILMDDNFSSIVKALLWGRAVNDAVKKFLQFQITVNITAVFLTFVSAVASENQQSVLTAVQLLWVNLIMDTFAALALATDPPTRTLLNRKPEPKSAPLISLTMWKMIIGQAIFQLAVTLILNFAGAQILSYESAPEQDRLGTLVFNTFVWMQIFNQLNSRRLDNGFNIFEGITRNYFFIGIMLLMIGGQAIIINFGGAAFSVSKLNGPQWGYSILLGFISIPIGIIIRLIPDEIIRGLTPACFKRKEAPPEIISDDFEWNQGLLEVREELAFIRKMRGGRLGALKWTIKHPKEALHRSRTSLSVPSTPNGERSEDGHSLAPPTPDSRRRRRSRSNSAFGPAAAMAGIVAGSIAGWSPIERRSGDNDSLGFGHRTSKSDLEGHEGVELHPDTKSTDPILVQDPYDPKAPPSQKKETTPNFRTGPFSGDPSLDPGKGKDKDDTAP
ncbi:calcium transporting P-type ATPase-like protein [Pseudovirgaria hyperparasitica]|uniref:Calcium-transporting ATPase n=1 Tax=Pseudovirgaria hyperparasitica TaxID=470096 RepID=A0A6A6W0N1_9PEZI|nr:calcium transporting P-type ATPase-like protein [Pseudovirgaria hyperparasitica]KAF2754631.1 calcium transporting P-type ATPase-like protein [Pseudovirgaria hyperparasitica]